MASPTSSLKSQRYIGDLESHVVHDLYHEDPLPDGCRAFELIKSGLAAKFEPDKLRQAVKEGYEICQKCMFGLDRRRVFMTRLILGELEATSDREEG